MNVAAAVATADGDELLVTHAGLTVGAWTEIGEPMTATSAAWLLNDRPAGIWRGGGMTVDRQARPMWAEAGWELHEPWLEYHAAGGLVPFGQIHGHSSIVRYADRSWRSPGRGYANEPPSTGRHATSASASVGEYSSASTPNTAGTARPRGNHSSSTTPASSARRSPRQAHQVRAPGDRPGLRRLDELLRWCATKNAWIWSTSNTRLPA